MPSSLSFTQIQGIQELSDVLYPLCALSGFVRAAQKTGVEDLWPEGSKTRALPAFLRAVVEQKRGSFCRLMQEIVAEALHGYSWNPQPLSRQKMEAINAKILLVGFKIPELWDKTFLSGLPSSSEQPNQSASVQNAATSQKPTVDCATFKARFLEISARSDAQQRRGYEFETFLNEWFTAYGLKPRKPFKIEGEQIDGSFDLDHHIYLVEARWRQKPVVQADLAVLDSRVAGHSSVGRGLFITAGSFSPDGLAAQTRLRPSAFVCFDGQDIFLCLEHGLPLPEIIRFKMRRLVEQGVLHFPVSQFWMEIKNL